MNYETIIIGAGAAGLMCAAQAAAHTTSGHKSVLVIDHSDKPGEKIRISGGGRCNFTHLNSTPKDFLSDNPHFCKSALSRYTPHDFLALVERYNIAWHEKAKGQLFCDGKSQAIIDMLLSELDAAKAKLWLGVDVLDVRKNDKGYTVTTSRQSLKCKNLIIACGGLSIPKMGASNFGYKIAKQFGLNVITPTPALVPLTFTDQLKEPLKALSGVSVDAAVSHEKTTFDEALLFTHRGLSGPSILQISSYWQPGDAITLNLAPATKIIDALKTARTKRPKQSPQGFLSKYLPTRLAAMMASGQKFERLADMNDAALHNLALMVNAWRVKPAGSEGFRTAEVTKGGVDTKELSSKTMEARNVPGLYFIGEVVDVTGHLGGHNFQWAWASAVACGQNL